MRQRNVGTVWVLIRLLGFQATSLLRTPFFLQTAILSPVAFFCFLTIGRIATGQPADGTEWLAAFTAGIWATTTTAVGILSFQRYQETLEPTMLSVLPIPVVLALPPIAASAIGLIGLPISLILQLLTGTSTVTSAQLIAVPLIMIAAAASSLALAALFLQSRNATAFEPLLLIPIWILSGLVVPVATFPPVVQMLAGLLPMTRAFEVASETTGAEIASMASIAIGVSVVWATAGGLAIANASRSARHTGTLGYA